MTAVDVGPERPDSDLAGRLLERYYRELDGRLPGGFQLDQTVAAPEAELVRPYGAFLVARIEGDPAGCGAVRKLDDTTAEIKRMWVDPAARGRGVGRRLLDALEGSARDLGCRRVRLDTNAVLTEALALYRSAGYVDIPAYNHNPYAVHWLEKSLTA